MNMDNYLLSALLSDRSLDNSRGFYSVFESYYINRGSKRIPAPLVTGEVSAITSEIKKIEGVSNVQVTGGIRRKNLYIENILILVSCVSKQKVMNQAKAKFTIEDCSDNRITRIATIDKVSIVEVIFFVQENEYISSMLKLTGSKSFFNKLKIRSEQKGINIEGKTKFTSEMEIFEKLQIPYVQPELRECIDNITIPYEKIIIDGNEKFEGDIIPYSNVGMLKQLHDNGLSYVGITITEEQFSKFGSGIIDTINSIKIDGLKIYVGINLECLSKYNNSTMSKFDFIYSKYYINNDSISPLYKIIKNISKPIILYDLGVTLATPLRIAETKIYWKSLFLILSEKKVALAINGNNIVNNLHPTLIHQYISNGGCIIPVGHSYNNRENIISLMRKSLVSLKYCITSQYRFSKFIQE